MGYGIIDTSTLTDIADAIRGKLGVQTQYKPGEMPEAIESISGGGITPTGTKSITQNGTYDVASYASAEVNVPSVTPTGTKQISITANGTTTEDVASYADAEISVNVPTGITPTGTKQVSITQNGVTTEDVTNYANAQISVNVVNEDYEDALVAFGVTEDLTDGIEALTTYANGVTGESDTTLSDAVASLADGYGGGGGYTGLEYVYASNGTIESLIWHGGGKIANGNFNTFFGGFSRNIPITFPDKPTLIDTSAFYNSKLRIDWTGMTEVVAIGSGAFRMSYSDDCTSDVVRMPKLDGLTHDGLTSQSGFSYVAPKGSGTYYFDTIKVIPREFFQNMNHPNASITFGSLGHAVEDCFLYPFHNSNAATVATVTTYTTGAYLDTVKGNLENAIGSGNITFVYKASEATTYNGTSYQAGDTITV